MRSDQRNTLQSTEIRVLLVMRHIRFRRIPAAFSRVGGAWAWPSGRFAHLSARRLPRKRWVPHWSFIGHRRRRGRGSRAKSHWRSGRGRPCARHRGHGEI